MYMVMKRHASKHTRFPKKAIPFHSRPDAQLPSMISRYYPPDSVATCPPLELYLLCAPTSIGVPINKVSYVIPILKRSRLPHICRRFNVGNVFKHRIASANETNNYTRCDLIPLFAYDDRPNEHVNCLY